MLYLDGGKMVPERIHGAFVSDKEVKDVIISPQTTTMKRTQHVKLDRSLKNFFLYWLATFLFLEIYAQKLF